MAAPYDRVSPVFLVITFAGAILIAVLLIYWGIHGQIGGPIP